MPSRGDCAGYVSAVTRHCRGKGCTVWEAGPGPDAPWESPRRLLDYRGMIGSNNHAGNQNPNPVVPFPGWFIAGAGYPQRRGSIIT